MRRIGFKPMPKEPPIIFKKRKPKLEVLFKTKICTTFKKTHHKQHGMYPDSKPPSTCCTLGSFGKLLMNRDALTQFETVWTYDVKAIDY
jgi:hypothetical protein